MKKCIDFVYADQCTQYSSTVQKIYQESLCKSNNNSLARIVRKNIESTHSKHHIVTIFGTLSSGHITQL